VEGFQAGLRRGEKKERLRRSKQGGSVKSYSSCRRLKTGTMPRKERKKNVRTLYSLRPLVRREGVPERWVPKEKDKKERNRFWFLKRKAERIDKEKKN